MGVFKQVRRRGQYLMHAIHAAFDLMQAGYV